VLTVVIFINNLPVTGSVQYSSTIVWHQFIVIRPEFRTLNQVKNCATAPIFTVKFLARLNAEKSTHMGAFFISVRLSWNPHPS
uniref:hypothetical protein n=1 Tax=Citrobacter freundii TaxID=546 RepID=UPI001BD1B6D6